MKRYFLLFMVLLIAFCAYSQPDSDGVKRWNITAKGQITFNCTDENLLPYSDNIEMAGKRVAGIISYSIDGNGKLTILREIFFPQLHEYKSETDSWFHDYRAYLQAKYGDDLLPKIYVGSLQFVPGKVHSVTINGKLNILHQPSKSGLQVSRSIFPSMDDRLFVEMWTLRNTTNADLKITSGNTSLQFQDFGLKGLFTRRVITDALEMMEIGPGEEISFSMKIEAKMPGEEFPAEKLEVTIAKRDVFIAQMAGSLQLETPSETLNTLFEFSKIRASESIFESELGLIHSPGGGRYYVGLWANDQAEYVNPFFPYLGYEPGIVSALNCYRAFAKEINPEYSKIRYSFEIEGLVKPFMKDRGDAAMIAYGASHFALASGDEKVARELWPLIEWCLEYCNRQRNDEGVIKSESDEMEGRIETGSANLSTSSLYYGALNLAVDLGKALKIPGEQVRKYAHQASQINHSIENYFGAKVEELDTYKYFKEHQHLRHWICLPLVVGINTRKEATVSALFDRLWTENGVHVEKNNKDSKINKVFWDRGTLYALRGTLIAGESDRSIEKLEQFSEKRLLGNHVPCVVEAYPEGNMAQLSAESSLYCRVFIEGLFGLKPRGFKCFELTPQLPCNWDRMSLNRIKAFGEDFDIGVFRVNQKVQIRITMVNGKVMTKTIRPGETAGFSF